mmetsp:Transcript_10194/g.22564  ORF Transcript_10194/g.22564 Transcript_10194/m.22564 type:complete len:218 (+) Transcript_10194:77-730(+)
MSLTMRPQLPRRNMPLPPLDGPRGIQHMAVAANSANSSSTSSFGLGESGSGFLAASPPSNRSSRQSSAGATGIGMLDSPQAIAASMAASDSRSTSASSYQGAGRPSNSSAANRSLEVGSSGDDKQTDAVVKAMLPVIKRGLASTQKPVFETALDSIRRIERMFGKSSLDGHLEPLAEALRKQGSQCDGEQRQRRVLELVSDLFTDETASKFRGLLGL